MEDYIRLSAAADAGNTEELDRATKALEQRVLTEARTVRQYISTPETTPFAILYLATEGLYAEIHQAAAELWSVSSQRAFMIAGPSTIIALLNSLAMGFRTMAINKKANEVWKVSRRGKIAV
jgi:DNA recombination protein RmuC